MPVDRETLTLAIIEILVALGAAEVFRVISRSWTDPRDPVGVLLALTAIGLPLVSAALRLSNGGGGHRGRVSQRR